MKRYAVGVSDMNEDIEVVIVEAEFPDDALIQAVIKKFNWDIRNEDNYAGTETIDDLITLAIQGDVLVSHPVKI